MPSRPTRWRCDIWSPVTDRRECPAGDDRPRINLRRWPAEHDQLARKTSPTGVQRASFVVSGRTLQPHHRPFMEGRNRGGARVGEA